MSHAAKDPMTLPEVARELANRIALYNANQVCAKCRERITDIDEAFVVHRATGEDVLIHFSDQCFSQEVQRMLEAYLAEPKIRWLTRAGLES